MQKKSRTSKPHLISKKLKSKDPIAEVIKPLPEMELPHSLTHNRKGELRTPSSRSIRSGRFQGQVLAHYSPVALTKLFNSWIRGLDADDATARSQMAKVFGFLSDGKGGVNVNVNQTNSNKAESQAEVRARGAVTTPDEMFRSLQEEKEQREIAYGKPLEFAPTPSGEFAPAEIEAAKV